MRCQDSVCDNLSVNCTKHENRKENIMQLFVAYVEKENGTVSAKETVAKDRFDAAKRLNVPVKYVQLSTRKN